MGQTQKRGPCVPGKGFGCVWSFPPREQFREPGWSMQNIQAWKDKEAKHLLISNQIVNRLDEIALHIFTYCPNINILTPREKARAVATYLRESNLTGIQLGRDYHCLEHNFLGFAINDPDHNSLPLISAAIYCYVAQKINLDARPCGFPFHVHVIVMPPRGQDIDGNAIPPATLIEPIFMDPFRSAEETPIENLQNQLNFLGASAAEQAAFLRASGVADTVLRCGKNIMNSVQRLFQTSRAHLAPVDAVSARYAALWSSLLFSTSFRPAELRHYLPWFLELFATDFPSDAHLIEQYLVPLFQGTLHQEDILESLRVVRAVDEIPKQVKRRTPERKTVRYRIGQVFRHRRYSYLAVITGWDTECDASEQWMRRMGIDRLEAGRHQSFYHALYGNCALFHCICWLCLELRISPYAMLRKRMSKLSPPTCLSYRKRLWKQQESTSSGGMAVLIHLSAIFEMNILMTERRLRRGVLISALLLTTHLEAMKVSYSYK